MSERPADDSMRRLARASNAFGFDLYAHVRLGKGNVVFSPASLPPRWP